MKKEGMKKNTKILLIVAIILILLVGGYFGVKAYSKAKFNKNLDIFQQGAQYGYAKAVMDIINISDTCKTFPVYVGNVTRELVSVTCYKNQGK
jgi:hypothetical protein